MNKKKMWMSIGAMVAVIFFISMINEPSEYSSSGINPPGNSFQKVERVNTSSNAEKEFVEEFFAYMFDFNQDYQIFAHALNHQDTISVELNQFSYTVDRYFTTYRNYPPSQYRSVESTLERGLRQMQFALDDLEDSIKDYNPSAYLQAVEDIEAAADIVVDAIEEMESKSSGGI